MMGSYVTHTTLGDFGPWVSKLVVELPRPVQASAVSTDTFSVYCARREKGDGSLVMRKERGSEKARPCEGYPELLACYPCDAEGDAVPASSTVALELAEERLNKRAEGSIEGTRFVENDYTITQARPILTEDDPICGLVFDSCDHDVCAALRGWRNSRMGSPVDGIALQYGYFEPEQEGKRPLVVWLHGAGEGGHDVELAYEGNRVTALSQDPIQAYFGGAWIVVPQSPTYWMDDGVEKLGRSNQSIYARPLKALIDEFVDAHSERIDTSRIVIGGLSNGGFMTVRMCADYPGFFSCGIPVCAPFYVENQTAEVLKALSSTPLWFVHSKTDEIVTFDETALPLYRSLKKMGAPVHMTLFDHVVDLTGRYRNADGTPLRTFSHGVWIHVYNNFCDTDIDGTRVMVDGCPVGVWEWTALMRR